MFQPITPLAAIGEQVWFDGCDAGSAIRTRADTLSAVKASSVKTTNAGPRRAELPAPAQWGRSN